MTLSAQLHATHLLPQPENVCAVVVTYHPDEGILDRLTRIAGQVHSVVVVDNGSNPAAVERLKSAGLPRNVTVLWNNENLGIATALNQGAWWAIEQGHAWALTFDQDSVADEHLLDHLRQLHAACGLADEIGTIGVSFWNSATNTRSLPAEFFGDRPWIEREVVITSGSLLSLAAFQAIGPFRDELFIDTVDEEYCLRLRRHGYRVLLAREPLLVHSLGTLKTHRLLWKEVSCTNHPPVRRYYQVRNRLRIIAEYWRTEPRWSWLVLKCTLVEFLLILLHETNKPPKIRAFLLGAWHALLGRMGKLPTPAAPSVPTSLQKAA